MNHRVGEFTIPRRFIDLDCKPLLKFFFDMIIVRAEMDFASDSIKYVALSPRFGISPENVYAPRYGLLLSVDRMTSELLEIDLLNGKEWNQLVFL